MEKQIYDEKRDQLIKLIEEIKRIEKPSISEFIIPENNQSRNYLSQLLNDNKFIILKEAYSKLSDASIEVLNAYKNSK